MGLSAQSFLQRLCQLVRAGGRLHAASDTFDALNDFVNVHAFDKCADALEIANEELPIQKYDVIFIDAAKAQYQKFFEKYEPLLKEDGMIISDNLIFHGHIFDNNQKQSRNLKQLVRKINRYNDWLANHPDYDTLLLPIGDGVAISLKKKVK